MPEKVNVQAKKQLAKLLATENLTVVHAGVRTATFDPRRRILTLPIWQDMTGDLYDVLVLHEVGHALYSPKGSQELIEACKYIDANYPAYAKTFINVVEDARIEKLIKTLYPGARASFVRGYKELVSRNFFGTETKDLNSFGIIDRINIYFKCGQDTGIQFSSEELEFVKAIENALTFDEVVDIAKKLYAYAKVERKRKKKEQPEQPDVESDESEEPNASSQELDEDGEDEEDLDPDAQPAAPPDDDVESDSDDEAENFGDGDSDGAEEDSSTNASGTETEGEDASEENDADDSPVESETDNSWSKKQEELRDINAKPIRYLGIPTPKLEEIVVDYKRVHQQIRSFYVNFDVKARASLVQEHTQEFERFKQENKPVVDWLLKEFEMHKAADQYSRTQTSRTGILDLKRLHEYKYADDIQKKNTLIPGGKNHANLTFVDFSGSMKEHMLGTVHQLINLAMFQRKAQIPFRVFTFGARKTHSKEGAYFSSLYTNNDDFIHKEEDYAFYVGFTLREILSSKMNAKEFNDACVNLLMLASGAMKGFSIFSSQYSFGQLPATDQMGGTPLNEAIVAAIPLTEQMYRSGAQRVSVTFLTDGEATTSGFYVANVYGEIRPINTSTEDVYLRDEVTKTDYKLDTNSINTTNNFLKILRDRTRATAVGFFICGNEDNQEGAFENFLPEKNASGDIEKLRKELQTNFFVVATKTGYTEFYILPGGKNLRISNPSGSIFGTGPATNAKLVTTMTEHGQKQRKQRVVLTRYIKLIS